MISTVGFILVCNIVWATELFACFPCPGDPSYGPYLSSDGRCICSVANDWTKVFVAFASGTNL